MQTRGWLLGMILCLPMLTGEAEADSVTLTLEYRTDTLEWNLYGLINDIATGNNGDFGFAAVRALIDNISFGNNGDAVTLPSGIGAIDPIAEGTPFERPAVLQTAGGTLDIIYGQDTRSPASVVGGVGRITRALLMSGSFPSAATPPAFGNDDNGFVTDGNYLNTVAPGPFGPALPWAGMLTLGVSDVTPAGSIGGDYNGDGAVNAADYTVWRDNFGGDPIALATGSRVAGNIGAINNADYVFWTERYGSTATAATVPEPTASVVVSIGFAHFLVGRRMRRVA
jgi:hypothetical protein